MTDLSPEFHRELEALVAELVRRLGMPPPRLQADAEAHGLRFRADEIRVPVRYEIHWRRFRSLPTELARDLAHAAGRAQGYDEVDAQAFAETFVRDVVLNRED